jgi:O-antigen/teichoic acid export membrane protein
MSQSKRGSLLETLTNTAIGLIVSVIANSLVFPRFGFHPSGVENVAISVIYTVISIVRGYCVRRMWNWIGLRRAV